MAAYEVVTKLRKDLEGLAPSEAEEKEPSRDRISASDAQRAISRLVNRLKDDQVIRSKNEIIILEVRIVA